MSDRNFFRLVASTHLMLIRNDEILLLRRFNTGYNDGFYSLVAGILNGNENVHFATAREAEEEIGIKIQHQSLKFVHVIHRCESGLEWIDFFFLTNHWSGEPFNNEPSKCDDLQWFKLENLPTNTVAHVRLAIDMIKYGIFYSEYGW